MALRLSSESLDVPDMCEAKLFPLYLHYCSQYLTRPFSGICQRSA